MKNQFNPSIQSLACDIGAESGRVISGSFDGEIISLNEVHRFSNGPVRVGNHLYTDILQIWQQIQIGLNKVIQASQQSIQSVGVDTWGVDYALLDRNNQLLGNPYHYRDHRTDGLLDEIFTFIPREDIYQRTGNQFMQFNSLVQLYAMTKQDPNALQRADTLLMLPDLLHFWLCGQKTSELCIATTTQCYDQMAGKWATDLINELHIPAKIFADISYPGTNIGNLYKWLIPAGRERNIPVILPASHDTGSAITAVPVDDPNFLYISSGTWSLVGTELDKPIITSESLQKNLTNEGNPCGKTRFLKIVPGMWLLQQCKVEWKLIGRDYSYDDLTQMAGESNACGSIIDVTSPEFLDPGEMVIRIQRYCQRTGQTIPQSNGEFIRCILESLAYLYNSLLNDFESVLNKRLNVIHIIGGGSRNTLLNQLVADITNRQVIAGPVEATAAGNILIQMMGLGQLSSLDDIRQVVRNSFHPMHYEPRQSELWESGYMKYQNILENNPHGIA